MPILAQVSDVPAWVSTMANAGAFGLLSWVVWYVFAKLLPSQMQSARELTIAHAETCKTLVATQAANIVQVQAEFREALREQREAFVEVLNAQRSGRPADVPQRRPTDRRRD